MTGECGIVYSSPAENGHPGMVKYKPYASWGNEDHDWEVSVPSNEVVVSIAAAGVSRVKNMRATNDETLDGNGNVVVATSLGYIRFFSGSGIQRYLWTLGADIVSMVAASDFVFVVYREGGTSLDGDHDVPDLDL